MKPKVEMICLPKSLVKITKPLIVWILKNEKLL